MSQNPYRGILLVWSLGEGEGKTTVLKEWSYDLSKVVWIRDDPKPLNFDTEKLGVYLHLEKETRGMKRYEIGHWFINLLDKVENKGYDGIVIDTCYYLGECICAMVDKNPGIYRENFSAMPEYKYPQIKGEGHIWHSKVLGRMAEKFKFVGLATHSMPKYDSAGVETGLSIPRVRPEVLKAASDIWLITPSDDGNYCPTALITKQSPKSMSTDKGERTLTILPKKVKPFNGELSLWDCYHRYYDSPISYSEKLEDYEIPSVEEMSFISGNMTPDQKRIYNLAVEVKKKELEGMEKLLQQQKEEQMKFITEAVKESGEVLPPLIIPKIITKVQEQYPNITEKDLSEMLKGA